MAAGIAYGIAGNILEKLGSLALDEICLAWGMKDDLQSLDKNTKALKAVLLDAQKKQEHNEELRMWLTQLKDVFYDAEDVLDEFECEQLRRQVVKEYGSLGRKVRRFFSRSNPLAFRFRIAHHIKELRQKLDEIVNEMSKFQLISSQLNQEQSLELSHVTRETHSFVDSREVIGRDSDKAQIIEKLTMHQDPNNDSNISIIPIVGIGGLGKTTLAKSIFNDKEVVGDFDLRMWVCVSLEFNLTEVVRRILVSATKSRQDHDLPLEQLQESLQNILKEKRFLLVLDDVWNEDPLKWHELRELLTVGAKGSKVIVTTRSDYVASIMGTIPSHKLKGLSDEDSLSLFFKCAFGDEKMVENFPNLKDIGKEIVKKCSGVPLALKSLGSLLCTKKTEDDWIFIRDNEIWELEGKHDGRILPALRISYNALPLYLKSCFAYCCIFPEDSEIFSLELIWSWMALGYLQSGNKKSELEDIGDSYLRELRDRSFLQCDGSKVLLGLGYECTMHDLIHNLACSITKDECSIVHSQDKEISERVRHIRIMLNENKPPDMQNFKKIRSIYVDPTDEESNIVELFLSSCISTLKHLRVFYLSQLSFEVLPSSIGTLKHLRYLGLGENLKIKKLPDSICKLQNLQTLVLVGCEELEELPRDIRNLVSLRTLFFTTKQEHLPENGIGSLKSLRFLGIGECKNLRSLPHDIMTSCTTLRTLYIWECGHFKLESEPINNDDVQLKLQKLGLSILPETTTLPQWLQGSAKTLQHLCIGYCESLVALPEWLPNLTSLRNLLIGGCPALIERCRRESGEDWPKIAHVPNINFY